ncbi:MAG: DHH family phosphoesterase [Methanobacteriota archaeon]
MYLVLGCGDVGFSVAAELKDRGVDLVIVDRDSTRVKQLKQLGYNAVVGDFGAPNVLKAAGFEKSDMILIMVPEFSAVQSALGAIHRLKAELKVDPVVVARVTDEMEVDEAKRLGASDALPSSQLLAKFAIDKFEVLKDMGKEKRLRALIQELVGGKLAIVLQTNPDPDSIASGVALKRYAKAFGLDSDLIYDGVVGHPQNRALVNLLELNLHEADKTDFTKYPSFALVDVATHANCSLPKDILPTIIIDHHSVPSGEVRGRYVDTSFVGANATIMTNYLRYGGVEVDGATAAALVVGILTDTMFFTRGAKAPDFNAFEYLMNLVDADLLKGLLWPTISSDALDVLATAIKTSKINSGYLLANVDEVNDRDLIAQAADFLLNRDGVSTTFIYGICGDAVRISARTKDVSLHLGQKLREAFSEIGSGGGHPRMAGATIPLTYFGKSSKASIKRQVNRVIGRRFLEAVGLEKPRKHKHKKKSEGTSSGKLSRGRKLKTTEPPESQQRLV